MNRRVAAQGAAISFFAPGTPLATDDELSAAWDVMYAAWSSILDALSAGCRLTSVLERFLIDHSTECVERYHRLTAHAREVRVTCAFVSVLDVIRELHEDAARRAAKAARSVADESPS